MLCNTMSSFKILILASLFKHAGEHVMNAKRSNKLTIDLIHTSIFVYMSSIYCDPSVYNHLGRMCIKRIFGLCISEML